MSGWDFHITGFLAAQGGRDTQRVSAKSRREPITNIKSVERQRQV